METDYTDDMGSDIVSRGDKSFERVDWRAHYRDHPLIFLGAAAGLGVILGAMVAPKAVGSAVYQTRSAPLRQALHNSPKVAQLRTTWQLMSDTLLGLATAKAVDAVAGLVPGFKDEYQRQNARHGGR